MDKEYLTVKEFAAAAEVTTQYIYKIYGSSLKPYTKTIKKKKMVLQLLVKLEIKKIQLLPKDM